MSLDQVYKVRLKQTGILLEILFSANGPKYDPFGSVFSTFVENILYSSKALCDRVYYICLLMTYNIDYAFSANFFSYHISKNNNNFPIKFGK